MTLTTSSQQFTSNQTDESDVHNSNDATGDSMRRVKTKLLAGIERTSLLLFGQSPNLLDDILSHPLSIDYLNIYLSLPIFGQRVLYHRSARQFDFDPPLLPRHSVSDTFDQLTKQWLIHYRLDHYIHTDIYIESLLSSLLIDSNESIHAFINSKEVPVEQQSHLFSTVGDVQQFHQFLQSTAGIKYWDFFIDSMRILRSRYSTRSSRIDISHLNFIHRYHSQQREFRSIMVESKRSLMPDSSTPDAVWLHMAINAVQQLRTYWLPRYLAQQSPAIRFDVTQTVANPSMKKIIATASSNSSHSDATSKQSDFVKYTLGHMSYLDYNPRQYIRIDPFKQHDFIEDSDVQNELDRDGVESEGSANFDVPSSVHSLEDYATDDNLELFYRILVSDSLAGSPFADFVAQTLSKTESIPFLTCLGFLADAQVIVSIPPGNHRTRVVRQFIVRYLVDTATDRLFSALFDNMDEQRMKLIKELQEEKDTQGSLLQKILLKSTKLLMPHFLAFVKFDRLRCLLQDRSVQTTSLIDDFRLLIPSVNFEALLSSRQARPNEAKVISRTNTQSCLLPFDDPRLWTGDHYHTSEKLTNTDERCAFRSGDRFPPLTDLELEQELARFCTTLQWPDVKATLGKSFCVPATRSQRHLMTAEDEPLPIEKAESILVSEASIQQSSIDTFTHEVMNSARDLLAIDRFVSTLLDESLSLYQTKTSSQVTDSSLPTFPLLITNDINMNAVLFSDSDTNTSEAKFLSTIGSYFINAPSRTSPVPSFCEADGTAVGHLFGPSVHTYLQNNRFKPINEFTLHEHFNSTSSALHGLVRELTIDDLGIGHLSVDLTKTNILMHDEDILKLHTKIRLYTEHQREFLLAEVQSYGIDWDAQELQLHLHDFITPKMTTSPRWNKARRTYAKGSTCHEPIPFAPKDKSSAITTSMVQNAPPTFSDDDQQQLLHFVQHQLSHQQWPLHEYIGVNGQRAWRAFKLASDISAFDADLMGNYHRDLDWISTDYDLGSFGQRTHLLLRNMAGDSGPIHHC